MKNTWAYIIGALLILVGIAAGFLHQATPRHESAGSTMFQPATGPAIQPTNNLPVVIGFKGDLEVGGTGRNEDVVPFVVGDVVKLECEALNAIQYRWLADGVVVKDQDHEWSSKPDREWDVSAGGAHRFAVQVRGADPKVVSQLHEKSIKTENLKIDEFKANITEDEDRGLTGSDYTVEVSMVEPLTSDNDFYRYRYSINDEIIKHPEDGEEWTTETSLTYTFPAAGKYTFKVEVRRATQKDTEATAILPQTITVADSVLLSFDAYPEKTAPLGATITLDSFPTSKYGKSECRYG